MEPGFTKISELQLSHFQRGDDTIKYDNDSKPSTINQQDCISFLALQASEIAINDESIAQKSFSIENIPFIEIFNDASNQIQNLPPKPRTRSPKPCRICSKCVLDLRRHLEQCHKELTRLQIVKIVAESKRFRKDLKKSPSKAVRNVLLCPHTNENGEICNRPIVEYKLYQHLKFYHHIHPKSEEGIRLVRQARANPFAYKSIFHENSQQSSSPNSSIETNSSENSDPLKDSDQSNFDFDSEPYEVRVSFPGNDCSISQLPTYSDANNTHIIQTIPTHTLLASGSSTPLSVSPTDISSSLSSSPSTSPSTSPISPIKCRPRISASPSISCQVLSIGLNIAVSCSSLPGLISPQEATCIITKHEDDVVFISIPSLECK